MGNETDMGMQGEEGDTKVQGRYIRWALEVDSRTPGCIIREETRRNKLRTTAEKRAWIFKEKLRVGKGGKGWEKEDSWR